jgi:hypothetical protein
MNEVASEANVKASSVYDCACYKTCGHSRVLVGGSVTQGVVLREGLSSAEFASLGCMLLDIFC